MTARWLIVASLLALPACRREVAAPVRAQAQVEAPADAPLSGIGIRPILDERGFAVGQVFPGSPAERAGLRMGDVVTDVDGESSARWTLERVATRLRGPAGSNVTLTLERGGVAMRTTITRDTLRDIPAVPQ